MLFWQGFLVLSAIAALFILWPTIVVHLKKRKRELMLQGRDINEVVYNDQLRELEATHGRGEIEASELKILKQDLEKTHIYESTQSPEIDRPIIANWRSRMPVIGLALAVPLVTLLIYLQVGAKQDWDIYQKRIELINKPEEAAAIGGDLIKALQNRLEKKPQNSHNWYLLGVTATDIGEHEEAVRAFRKLNELEPNSAVVLAELAQAHFRWAGTITPEVRSYIQQTLSLQNDNTSILGLAGIDAFQSAQYADAIDFWTRAINKMNPHSAEYSALTNGINQAKAALKGGASASRTVAETDVSSAVPKSVSVRVSLADKAEVDPEAIVFVYARAWQGARIPLAIQKLKVADLPRTVKLDESMAMDPNRSLATAPQVEIVARVSKSGNAVPQPGDWQGAIGPVVPGSPGKRVKLVIDGQVEQ